MSESLLPINKEQIDNNDLESTVPVNGVVTDKILYVGNAVNINIAHKYFTKLRIFLNVHATIDQLDHVSVSCASLHNINLVPIFVKHIQENTSDNPSGLLSSLLSEDNRMKFKIEIESRCKSKITNTTKKRLIEWDVISISNAINRAQCGAGIDEIVSKIAYLETINRENYFIWNSIHEEKSSDVLKKIEKFTELYEENPDHAYTIPHTLIIWNESDIIKCRDGVE